MPLPMVHLAVAVQLYGRQQSAPPGTFLLGSLAPDAIHARPGSTRADKNITHFHLSGDREAFLQRVRTFAERSAIAAGNRERKAMDAGYVAHVLTDSLWGHTVYARFRKDVEGEVTTEERKALYYRETEKVDFALYHSAPWQAAVWQALAETVALDVEPFVSASEVAYWQRHTLQWFHQHEEPEQVPQWLTEARVREFIDRAVEAVDAQWRAWGFVHWP